MNEKCKHRNRSANTANEVRAGVRQNKDNFKAFTMLGACMVDTPFGGEVGRSPYGDFGVVYGRNQIDKSGLDAVDFAHGAQFIPAKVTLARRKGVDVVFVQVCGPCCWYWEFPDSSRCYHFDKLEYERIANYNRRNITCELAGSCPNCGNEHTNGSGTVTP